MREDIHPFEVAGLGLAPFRFVGMTENVYSAAPGHSQPGGSCDYCCNGIKYECHIVSSDGKRFKVGTDCVLKLGRADNRLISSVKRAKLMLDREQREKVRQAKIAAMRAKREAELDRQRVANGGLTDDEVAQAAERAKIAAQRQHWVAVNGWLLDVLSLTRGDFAQAMADRLCEGPVSKLSDRAIGCLRDIYARNAGRRGSKAYVSAEAKFDEMVGEAVNNS